METTDTIQLHDICQCLRVRDRDARYVLERGFVPKGVDVKPASGNHRQFSAGQAFWLGLVLKLKASGINTPLAARLADYAARSVQTVTQNLDWEYPFLPTQGRLRTQHQYFIEIADLAYVRFVTDANPSKGGQLEYSDWHALGQPGKPVMKVEACVIVRLDIARISHLLLQAFQKPRFLPGEEVTEGEDLNQRAAPTADSPGRPRLSKKGHLL
jgi:hypothetical protein